MNSSPENFAVPFIRQGGSKLIKELSTE